MLFLLLPGQNGEFSFGWMVSPFAAFICVPVLGAFFYVDGAVIFLLKKMPFLFGSCASTDAGFSCSARRYWSPFKLINFKCDF